MTLDFSTPAHYLLALLPEIVLSVWGIVVLLAGVWKGGGATSAPRAGSGDLAILAMVGVLAAALANGWLYGLTPGQGSTMIAVDRFHLFANWIFLLAAVLALAISPAYVRRQRLQEGEFHALVLFATVGMMLMGGTRDLIVIFLALELMSISAYILSGFNRRDPKSAESGLKYFLLGAFSTGFLLYGIALVYGATGSTNLGLIALAIDSGAAVAGLLHVGIALLAVGFAFKVSAIPFHMWTPDVYEGAPSPVTAFMSASVKAAAFVAFARVFVVGFGGIPESWHAIGWWLAALTMVIANVIALAQTNVKRLLAYSSIAHAGYLLVAIVALNQNATAGLLFYLLVYTAMNIGAFAVILCVSGHGEERLGIDRYAGLGARHPALAVCLTIFLLSLAGFPGTGGFMGKIFILQGAAEAGLWTLSVIFVLTTVVSYYYYLRIAWYMWMREAAGSDEPDPVAAPLAMRFAMGAAVALVIGLGVFPGGGVSFARAGAEGLLTAGALLLGAGP